MANKNFIVQNGLTVGGVTIDATSGNITTTGVLTTTNSEHPAEFQGNLSVGGTLTLNGLLLEASSGGAGALLSGTIVLGSGMGRYTTYSGSITTTPTGIIREIAQTGGGGATLIYLNYGTFGSYTIDATGVNGSGDITVTIGSVTETISGIGGDFGTYLLWALEGDPFSIYNTDTHTISITAAGGGGTAELTVGGDLTASVGTFTTISATSDVNVGGNLVVTGTTTFNGGTLTLGDAATDNVVFGADVNSSIVPNTDATYNLGSVGQQWNNLYLTGTASIDTLAVDENATVAGTLGVTGVTTMTSAAITNTTETTAPGTGALIVDGGASFASNAYVAKNLYVGSSAFGKNLSTPTIIAVDNGSNYAQMAMINTSGNGSSDFAAYADNGDDNGGWVDMGIAGSTFSDSNYGITRPQDGYLIAKPTSGSYGGNVVIATSSIGTHKDVVIGVGGFSASSEVARFHGNVSTSGSLAIKYPTVSTSSTSGALTVVGGAGIGGDLYVGGNITAAALNTVSTTQLSVDAALVYLEKATGLYPYNFDIGMYSHYIGGPANTYVHSGGVRSAANGYWGFFSNVKSEPGDTINWSDAGLIWDTIKVGGATLANTTAATSTTSGALTVAGGAGIAGAVYIGGDGTNAIVHTGHILPSANITYNLGSSTAWYGSFYGVATQAKYADLAENYQADSNYQPGQVLMFGGTNEVTIASADTTAVAGVVSTNPAHLMNGALKGNNVVALALTGRVPCNVIGPVKKGDLMVSAGFGYAKVNNTPAPGTIIGKALADFTGAKGQIEVVVGRF